MTEGVNLRKVAMIGCGFVGSASAFSLMNSGLFSEMVLIDANKEKVHGKDQAGGHVFHMVHHLQAPEKLHGQKKVHGRHAEDRDQRRRFFYVTGCEQGGPQDPDEADKAQGRPGSCPDGLMQLGVIELLCPDHVQLHIHKKSGHCRAQQRGKDPNGIFQGPVFIIPEKSDEVIKAENSRYGKTCQKDKTRDQ